MRVGQVKGVPKIIGFVFEADFRALKGLKKSDLLGEPCLCFLYELLSFLT